MLKSVYLHFLPFLRCFFEFQEGKGASTISLSLDPRYYRMKMFKRFKNRVERIERLQVIEVSLHWLFLPADVGFETM